MFDAMFDGLEVRAARMRAAGRVRVGVRQLRAASAGVLLLTLSGAATGTTFALLDISRIAAERAAAAEHAALAQWSAPTDKAIDAAFARALDILRQHGRDPVEVLRRAADNVERFHGVDLDAERAPQDSPHRKSS
jgi:hypothetical protein